MKLKTCLLIAGLCVLGNSAFAQSTKEMDELREQLKKQQEQLDKLAKDMAEKNGPGVELSSHLKKLKIKGDLRLRYEYRKRKEFVDTPAPGRWVKDDRDRFRQRVRVDVTYDWTDNWLIHMGLATGGSDATSTNDTYSEGSAFETGDIRLDFAYAKYTAEN